MTDTACDEKKKILEELARLLIINHLQKSEVDLKKVFNGEYASVDEYRVVVLVGSAASYEAGIDSSSSAVDSLKKLLNHDEEEFDHAIKYLTTVFRLNEKDFETNLLALSYQKGHLRQELKELFNCRYFPLQSYEILAHLLKHRFVDVIINFNFDELLDQSIEDEFATGYYHKIITEGDCSEELLALEDGVRIDVPVYIKPHSTASHPSTMRFTREDYFIVPEDIKTVLTNIVTKKKTILLSVGFGMQSLELKRIIREHDSIVKTFYFNTEIPNTNRRVHDKAIPITNTKEKLINVEKGDSHGISKELSNLWRVIVATYKVKDNRYLGPRGIDRHLAIAWTMPKLLLQNYYKTGELKPFCGVDEMRCRVIERCDPSEICDQGKICNQLKSFRHRKREEDSYKADYFRSRTVLELVISIAKAKGLVIMSNLKNDRCGKYLEKYHVQLDLDKAASERNKNENNGEMKKWTLPEIIELLNFKTVEYGREIYVHKDVAENNKGPHKRNRILQGERFSMWLEELRGLFCTPNRIFKKALSGEEYEILKKYLEAIYRGEEVELTYRKNNPHEKIFRDPVPIRTYTALKWHTHSLLKEDWDQLYVVAETGEWLMNEVISKIVKQRLEQNKPMFILLADETKAKSGNSHMDKILNNKYTVQMRLPWWIHNKHMTICYRENGAHKAIYFNRRMKTNYIEAVRLEGDDCETVLDIFFAYWAKATKLSAELNVQGSNPSEISHIEMSKAKKLIQSDHYFKSERVEKWHVLNLST